MDATVVSKAQDTNVLTRLNFVFEKEESGDSDFEDDMPSLLHPDDDSSSDEESDSDDNIMESEFEVNEMGYESDKDGGDWTTVGDVTKFPGYEKNNAS